MVSTPTATNSAPAASHWRACGQPLACLRFGGGQNARRLARAQDARNAVVDGRLHLGVPWVARVAHRCRQVRRADEHAVHAGRGGNGVQVVHGFYRLGLHQQADLLVGLVHVLRVRLPARRAGQRAAHAAHAFGRIARGAHQLPGLLGGVHHGYQQGLGADVQVLLDEGRVAHRHARHGVGRLRAGRQGAGGAGDGLQLVQDGAQVVGRMFAINQQPVVAGARKHFCAVGVGQPEPQADLCLALGQGLFEGVVRCLQSELRTTLPSPPSYGLLPARVGLAAIVSSPVPGASNHI